jgi:hypothetical protein
MENFRVMLFRTWAISDPPLIGQPRNAVIISRAVAGVAAA